MERAWDIVVIGAGSAGVAAVEGARRQNADARILLLDEDQEAPYKRTQLSKYLASGFEPGQFSLRDRDCFADGSVEIRTGKTVTSVDREQKTLTLSAGEDVSYGTLVLATGSVPMYPRVVRPHEVGSFFVLRTLEDARRLIDGLARAKTVLVDGMGVLALEVTDQLIQMQKKPTLVGATAQLMPRQLTTRAAELMEEELVRNKVKLMFQDEILSFEDNGKGALDVAMLKGSGAFDAVVFCIGVRPRTDLAAGCGLKVDRGICVNERLQSSDPAVFVAGDCAQHPDGYVSYLWHAAEYQGWIAGENAAGGNAVFDRQAFRLKSSIFDTFVFSMNMPRETQGYRIEEVEVDNVYQAFFFTDEGLDGVVVLNDEPRSEQYNQAVVEHWSVDRVADELML